MRGCALPGNTSDVATVKKVRTDLSGWKLGRALFFVDPGMNSEKNRKAIARTFDKYLAACSMSNLAAIRNDVFSKSGRYTVFKENFHPKEVVVGEGERSSR